MNVVVVGNLNVDVVYKVARLPISGETTIATESFIAAGEKGATQAAARLGATVTMIDLGGNDKPAGWR